MQATITSKGQVTLPKPIRDRLGLTEGTQLDFDIVDGVIHARPVNRTALDIFGILRRPGQRPVSLEEMDQAIAQATVARHLAATPPEEDSQA